jgi:hypothetical protein
VVSESSPSAQPSTQYAFLALVPAPLKYGVQWLAKHFPSTTPSTGREYQSEFVPHWWFECTTEHELLAELQAELRSSTSFL